MICLSLCCRTLHAAESLARQELPFVDVLELRADYLAAAEYESIRTFPERFDLPVILTIRRSLDGGQWHRNEEERLELLKTHASAFTYCDVEHDYPDFSLDTQIIRSFHDFSGIPDNLEAILRDRGNAAIVKAAVMLTGCADLRRLWTIGLALKREAIPFILIGMGQYGTATRILTKRLGSWLTYVSANANAPVAPGHLSVRSMTEVYRYREIREDSPVFAIIGNPVKHSRSPVWHNKVFADKGIHAVYIPCLVDNLAIFKELMTLMGIRGASVTVPHKEGIISLLDASSDAVQQTGSCNTVVSHAGTLTGYNTDAEGFLKTLERLSLTSVRRASVIGAGGSARAIVYALRQYSMDVCVLNRNLERARFLAEQFPGTRAAPLTKAGDVIGDYSDIIVQCTTLGMDGFPGDPIVNYQFSGSEVVYDIIYTPEYTQLLQRARAAGCRVINGIAMFHAQAEEQSDLFLKAL